jgi:hypothetical protein
MVRSPGDETVVVEDGLKMASPDRLASSGPNV